MILYDLFKVLSDDIKVLVRNQENKVIFYGNLYDIHSKYLMTVVSKIKLSPSHMIVVYIIER